MLHGNSRKDYLNHKETARELIASRLSHFNQFYNFKFNRVSIRNQKTRWGSCSSKGNLNFNFLVVKLPPEFVDYVVVHELCHLKEFNHSPKYWALVEQTIPNYKQIRSQLKRLH